MIKAPAVSVAELVRAQRLTVSIEELERRLLTQDQPTCDVRHSFAPGLYVREVTLPANNVVVGHYHKTAHLNVMIQGRMLMVQPDGTYKDYSAPFQYVGLPGRKIALTLEKCVWLNVFATEETDITKLEATLLEKSAVFQEHVKQVVKPRIADTLSYEALLAQFKLDPAEVTRISENTADQIPFPYGTYKCKIGASAIHGLGVIATADIPKGEPVAPALIAGKRTPAGRYANHGATPNAAMMMKPNGDVDLVAVAPIRGCVGGMDGEEITVDYAQTLKLNLIERAA